MAKYSWRARVRAPRNIPRYYYIYSHVRTYVCAHIRTHIHIHIAVTTVTATAVRTLICILICEGKPAQVTSGLEKISATTIYHARSLAPHALPSLLLSYSATTAAAYSHLPEGIILRQNSTLSLIALRNEILRCALSSSSSAGRNEFAEIAYADDFYLMFRNYGCTTAGCVLRNCLDILHSRSSSSLSLPFSLVMFV